MRRPFIIGRPAPTVLVSPEAALGKALASQWIFRLLELPIPLDSRFFACLRWCANGLKDLPPMLQKQMSAYTGRKRIYTKIRQTVGELQNIPEKRLHDTLEEFVEDHAWFGPQLKLCLQAFITSRVHNDDCLKSYTRSLKKFQNFFGLSNEAMKLCSLAFMTGNFRPAENYFEDTLHLQSFDARRTLSYMLDIPTASCRDTISQLEGMGIIDVSSTSIRLCDNIDSIWQKGDEVSLKDVFCSPLRDK